MHFIGFESLKCLERFRTGLELEERKKVFRYYIAVSVSFIYLNMKK